MKTKKRVMKKKLKARKEKPADLTFGAAAVEEYTGGPNAQVEGASAVYGVSMPSLYEEKQRADNKAGAAKREAFPPYLVCCARTTKKVRGGRACQVCKGFVAGEGRE